MAEQSDVLLQLWQEQRSWARQSEDQRATLTNLVLVIAAAALGFISQQGIEDKSMLFVSTALGLLGVFGALGTAKFYERFSYHMARARVLRQCLADSVPEIHEVMDLEAAARPRHEAEHRFMFPIRLHHIWMAFHIAIATLGVGLSVAIALS